MSFARDIAGLCAKSKKIHLIVHCNPDGDTIGSAVALKTALGSNRTVIVSKDPIPEIFQNIVGKIIYTQELTEARTVLILDTTELHRTGFESELKQLKKDNCLIGVVDHHKNGNLHRWANYIWQQTDSAATAQMVFQLIEELRIPISRKIATALLLGLYTDTGGFAHANTSSSTLATAAKLVSHGANLAIITETFAPRRNVPQMKLWGYAISAIKVTPAGFAITNINQKSFSDSGASHTDVLGLANWMLALEDAKIALVLVETSEGWRGTMRSKNKKVDLSKIAQQLGGRGTHSAAGFLATETEILGIIKGAF